MGWLRRGSEPGQDALAGDSRDPAVGSGIAAKRGTRRRLACAAGGRTGASTEGGGTSRRRGG